MTRKELEFNFFDIKRSRQVPTICYLPKEKLEKYPVIIFGPGYAS